LRLEAPPEAGELVPVGLCGEEGLSSPFSFEVSALSPQAKPDPNALLGRELTVFASNPAGKERAFRGIVSAFSLGPPVGRGMRAISLTLVPRLALLARRYDLCVFQNKTVPDLVAGIFDEANVGSIEKRLSTSYTRRDYCIQYGESTLEFIQRLLAEEGIFYYFACKDEKLNLVLADNASALCEHVDGDVAHSPNAPVGGALTAWGLDYDLHTGLWNVAGFDELAPSRRVGQDQRTTSSSNVSRGIVHYDYSGLPLRDGEDAARARRRIEAEEATFEIARGASLHANFAPGVIFTLTRAPEGGQERTKWLITSVRHEFRDARTASASGGTYYRNSFSAIPNTVPYRPQYRSRPPAAAPQTAVVVGPPGEEIYCDEFGRVKVQFHWDRRGKRDEHSSCWIRVAQNIAGNRWGGLFLPRVGQEVVVEFLQGDPDQPLVTGAVYNGDNRPPFSLPAEKTKSGFKSRATPGGDADSANILAFDDKRGAEEVLLRAERDARREVGHDDVVKVGNDQTITVAKDRKLRLDEGSETVTLAKGNRDVVLETGRQTLSARSIALTATQSITLSCGETKLELTPSGASIKAMSVTINGDMKAEISGGMTRVKGTSIATVEAGLVKIN
jgi:type VI secretion system secreted protein VgrG